MFHRENREDKQMMRIDTDDDDDDDDDTDRETLADVKCTECLRSFRRVFTCKKTR